MGAISWCVCTLGQGCDEKIEFDCGATDVCNLKLNYFDFNVDLKPAHDCMQVSRLYRRVKSLEISVNPFGNRKSRTAIKPEVK